MWRRKKECCDYLEIGFGSVIGENQHKKLCGREKHFEPIYFNKNEIWLRFNSDDNESFKGFSLVATPFQSTYTELKNEIFSPNYDNSAKIYPNDVDVTYKINVPSNYIIVVTFHSINLEKFNQTCFDYIEIIEPTDPQYNETLIVNATQSKPRSNKVICGNDEPSDYVSSTNKLNLRFHSDESFTGDLFHIEYKTIQRVFTEPDYSIFYPMYVHSDPTNITYSIIAPKDHKIEIRIVEFNFTSCKLNSFDELINKPHKVCYRLNDYLMLTNSKGYLHNEMFEVVNNIDFNGWVFCDCNKPLRRYMSIGNHLQITLVTRTTDKNNRNRFRIAYKFIPNLYTSARTVEVIQDSLLSYIGGYMLRVKVPLNNNLRLYGKSIRCNLPPSSFLFVERQSISRMVYLKNTTNRLTNSSYCSYLFDINEPRSITMHDDSWFLTWYFPFKHSFESINFEINWDYMTNDILNKEKGVYTFPPQYGFNISDEISLKFEIQTARQYVIQFLAGVESANNLTSFKSLIDNSNSYIKIKKLNKEDDEIIHTGYLENPKNTLLIDSDEAILKVKRNELWSVNVSYHLNKYHGDCDFEESICDYKKENKEYYNLEHKVRNEWKTNIDEPTNFYLAITKPKGSDVQRAVVYTPSIVERDFQQLKAANREYYNKKVYSLSFSFKPGKNTDKLEVFLHTNRSEMYLSKNTDEIQLIKRFSVADGEPLKQTSKASSCSTYSLASDIQNENIWYRMKNILLYSCYDFRLGFAALFGQDSNFTETVSTIGIDDVNIDFRKNVENCKENICGEHGSCVSFFGKSICCCNIGYEGTNCEEKTTICPKKALNDEGDETNSTNVEELCKNGGICTDLENQYDYVCKCPVGYTGRNCENEINECESSPCLNGGKCFDKIGYYKCACNHGYSGANCEIKEPGCSKCVNSTCINLGRNQIKCLCPRGRTGDDCSIDVDECISNPCNSAVNSTCVNLNDAFKCLCPPDYTGKVCEIKIDYCKDYPKDVCKNEGICVSENGNMTCRCHRGYIGQYCEIEINECLEHENPCNGGTCIDKYLDFICECPKGRTGRYCETILENPCYGHKCLFGKCVPTFNNSYECSCNPFYQGEYCDEPKKCNIEEYAKECNPIGTLKVVGYGPTCLCKCKVGFYGEKCEFKEDLCKLKSYECLNGGTCIDTGDNIKCICRHGFKGDMCEIAENACKEEPCEHGRCKNYGSYYVCHCDRGWTGENCTELEKQCNKTIDCVAENTEEALNYDAIKCLCRCKNGFTGERCETNINDCEVAKANCNHGKCIDLTSTYRCECNEGYTGSFCETKISGCDAKPCNYGNCIETTIGFRCECIKGYTGLLCENRINNCDPNPCENGGTCHDYIDNYVCECPPEYGQSRNCNEMKKNPCLRDPCQNNGTCVPITSLDRFDQISITYLGFTCQCGASYTGTKCETLKTPCLSSPCQNFGTCENTRDNRDYNCKCFPLFTGKNCESNYNACEINPCLNGGTCYQTAFGFKCQCIYTHEGVRCERRANLCAKFSCLNGGTCQVEDNIPFCKCGSSRYIGTRCEIDLATKENATNAEEGLSEFLSETPECGLFGNDATLLTYILAALTIFLIFLIIIAIIYFYVHCSIKKLKNYRNKVSFENGILQEMNEFSSVRRIIK